MRSFSVVMPLNSINTLSVIAASLVDAARAGDDDVRMDAAAMDEAKKSLRVGALLSWPRLKPRTVDAKRRVIAVNDATFREHIPSIFVTSGR